MFKYLFKRRSEEVHAVQLYSVLLSQSRQPAFYGSGRVSDTYDGRIDMLSLHQGAVMHRLKSFGQDGQSLTQALYDIMVEDFNIAMREEGLADTGISRRIKPMIALFYARLKGLSEALGNGGSLEAMLREGVLSDDEQSEFAPKLADYLERLDAHLKTLSLEQIQSVKLNFPAL